MSNEEALPRARGVYHLSPDDTRTLCGQVVQWPSVVASKLTGRRSIWVERLSSVGLSAVCQTCDEKGAWSHR